VALTTALSTSVGLAVRVTALNLQSAGS